jgi:hypothetical protein
VVTREGEEEGRSGRGGEGVRRLVTAGAPIWLCTGGKCPLFKNKIAAKSKNPIFILNFTNIKYR